MKPDYRRARADVVHGIVNWRLWSRMGWQEIKRRYRRTVLGPFWVTLSLGMFVGGMGFIWAPLFGVSVSEYLPFISTGMICWVFVSSIITESCITYVYAEGLIKQLNFPLSVLNLTLVWRNVIVLFHNLVIVVIVFAALQISPKWEMFLFLPGVLLIAINGVWISMLLGMVSARYRDMPQLVASLVQIMMFVTPVFWYAKQLGARARFIDYNPLFHLIDVVRSPLLGNAPSLLSYVVVAAVAVLGWLATVFIYARFRRRIPFWL